MGRLVGWWLVGSRVADLVAWRVDGVLSCLNGLFVGFLVGWLVG